MPRTIIVFANCRNPSALGDFSTAGKLAYDLAKELQKIGIKDVEVVLSTNRDRLSSYQTLYGAAVDGKVTIRDVSIKVAAIEDISSEKDNVISYIEANRCRYASNEILERVLSPSTKMLQVFGPHQPDLRSWEYGYGSKAQEEAKLEQWPIFQFYDVDVGSLGIDSIGSRYGLTTVLKAENLRKLTPSEKNALPNYAPGTYSFAYFNDKFTTDMKAMVNQFISLSGQNQFMLVGKYGKIAKKIARSKVKEHYRVTYSTSDFGSGKLDYGDMNDFQMTQVNRMDNISMRHMIANAGNIVGVAGVASVIEALIEGKLIYFPNSDLNTDFIDSYNATLRTYLLNTTLNRTQIDKAMDLSITMMRSTKPMSSKDFYRMQLLLKNELLTNTLSKASENIISQAQGKVAGILLPKILGVQTPSYSQLNQALSNLRKGNETSYPDYEKALRRACFWGKPLEVKILLQHQPKLKFDIDGAVQQGKTPLYFAVVKGHTYIANLLLLAGANNNVATIDGKSLRENADRSCYGLLDNWPDRKLQRTLRSLRKNTELTNPDIEKGLRRAAAWGRVADVEILLSYLPSKQFNVNAIVPANGMTALHFAAIKGNIDMIELLVNAGADVAIKDMKNRLPVDLAKKNTDISRLLQPKEKDTVFNASCIA